MRSLTIAPFDPMSEKEPFGHLRLHLAAFNALVFSFVTLVVITFRINVGIERDPFSVGRPNGIACSA